MKILFHLGHPAHFHLFKNVIENLKNNCHEITILIKSKDILEDLLLESGIEYLNILPQGRKDNLIGIALGQLNQDLKMFNYVRKNRVDVMIGSSVAITHVGKLLRIPSISVGEDDAEVVPLYSYLSYPFADVILSPDSCDNGRWNKKTTHYNSYHELAYLHPNQFIPDTRIVEKYVSLDKPYFIIRFSKLGAHHDKGISGISDKAAEKIIKTLKSFGRVIINSEKELKPELEALRMKINPLHMHHLLAFADLYVGDSQTMAAEAAVLGTPSLRLSDFVGRLGYLEELEHKFGLTYGFKPSDLENLLIKVKEILKIFNLKKEWEIRKDKMLTKKIDFSEFLTSFIETFFTKSDMNKLNKYKGNK